MRIIRLGFVCGVASLAWLGCTGDVTNVVPDASTGNDSGGADTGTKDSAVDTGSPDTGSPDTGTDSGPKLACDPAKCDLGTQVCCYTGLNQGACQAIGDGGASCNKGTASQFNCSTSSQCSNGNVCCATDGQLTLGDAGATGYYGRCTSGCTGSLLVSAILLCDGPNDTTTCAKAGPDGGAKTCSPVTNTAAFPPSYYYCK